MYFVLILAILIFALWVYLRVYTRNMNGNSSPVVVTVVSSEHIVNRDTDGCLLNEYYDMQVSFEFEGQQCTQRMLDDEARHKVGDTIKCVYKPHKNKPGGILMQKKDMNLNNSSNHYLLLAFAGLLFFMFTIIYLVEKEILPKDWVINVFVTVMGLIFLAIGINMLISYIKFRRTKDLIEIDGVVSEILKEHNHGSNGSTHLYTNFYKFTYNNQEYETRSNFSTNYRRKIGTKVKILLDPESGEVREKKDSHLSVFTIIIVLFLAIASLAAMICKIIF